MTARALANPAYRPPRSWVLVALAAGLAVSLLAACPLPPAGTTRTTTGPAAMWATTAVACSGASRIR